MITSETLFESKDKALDLTPNQAAALAALGARLARTAGADIVDDGDVGSGPTLIRVQPQTPGRYLVRVVDAIGVLSIGDLQLVVQPKIPPAHLLHLFARSGAYPQLSEQQAYAETSTNLWELVARWFVDQAELTLRAGLVRDYHPAEDELRFMRGQLDQVRTARNFYDGRVEFACSFDEFGLDNPLNRLIAGAARVVVSSALLRARLRRRARRVLARLEGVGHVRRSDIRATIDRRTGHYRDTITLARHILLTEGRALSEGTSPVWTFLLRTPLLVEAGVRAVLAEAIGHRRVTKVPVSAIGANLSFNPDLVFDQGVAVGDVKYKLSDGSWTRSDLYQAITFAEAFRCRDAALVRFRLPGVPALGPVGVGDKRITEFTWLADERPPSEVARDLGLRVSRWLDEVVVREGRVTEGAPMTAPPLPWAEQPWWAN